MHQEMLPLAEPDAEGTARPLTLDEQFDLFRKNHADVLALFRQYAGALRAAGHQRGSSKLIWERIRYEKMTSAHRSRAEYALNNNLTSRAARWLVEVEPSYAGWFETRALKSRSQP